LAEPLSKPGWLRGNVPFFPALKTSGSQEDVMDRIRVLEDSLWRQVPSDVIKAAKQAAKTEPAWIAMQGNGHVVAMAAPGSPDTATGDVIYIAEIAPERPA